MPPIGTIEQAGAVPVATPEQVTPSVVPDTRARLEDHSDEVLKALENEDIQTEEAVPNSSDDIGGELRSQPEAPITSVVPEKPVTEEPEPTKSEASIPIDSQFTTMKEEMRAASETLEQDMAATQSAFERKMPESPSDYELDMPVAETMIEENNLNPNRGIHNEMDPAFKSELTSDIEKGIEKAEEKFEETLARLRNERNELREKAIQKKETLAAELKGSIVEKDVAKRELMERQSAETKGLEAKHVAENEELNQRYDQEIQQKTAELASIEQVLSEI